MLNLIGYKIFHDLILSRVWSVPKGSFTCHLSDDMCAMDFCTQKILRSSTGFEPAILGTISWHATIVPLRLLWKECRSHKKAHISAIFKFKCAMFSLVWSLTFQLSCCGRLQRCSVYWSESLILYVVRLEVQHTWWPQLAGWCAVFSSYIGLYIGAFRQKTRTSLKTAIARWLKRRTSN